VDAVTPEEQRAITEKAYALAYAFERNGWRKGWTVELVDLVALCRHLKGGVL
jgi:hypothetical protein